MRLAAPAGPDTSLRLRRVLEFAERAVDLLAADGYRDPGDANRSISAEKVVGETALLLLVAAPAAGDAGVAERLEALVRRIIPLARGEKIRALVCLEPSLALDHSLAHACLSRLGYPDHGFDRLLRHSLEADCAAGRERLPHRQLEQEWLLRVWNPLPSAPPVDAALPRRCALGRPVDLLSYAKDDLYAFTHSVMYLTDLGSRLPPLPRPPAAVAAEADAALACALDEPDYDLAGELMLVWPYLRRRWTPTVRLAQAVLDSVEDRYGFVPAPGADVDRLDSLSGGQRDEYSVVTSYHTVYVSGLVRAAVINQGHDPGDGSLPPHRGAGSALLEVMAPREARAPWGGCFDGLREGERDGLAPFLLNVCLRRAAARRDVARIRRALLVAEAHGLLDMPAARQAAQLLLRSALFGSLRAAPPAPSA